MVVQKESLLSGGFSEPAISDLQEQVAHGVTARPLAWVGVMLVDNIEEFATAFQRRVGNAVSNPDGSGEVLLLRAGEAGKRMAFREALARALLYGVPIRNREIALPAAESVGWGGSALVSLRERGGYGVQQSRPVSRGSACPSKVTDKGLLHEFLAGTHHDQKGKRRDAPRLAGRYRTL